MMPESRMCKKVPLSPQLRTLAMTIVHQLSLQQSIPTVCFQSRKIDPQKDVAATIRRVARKALEARKLLPSPPISRLALGSDLHAKRSPSGMKDVWLFNAMMGPLMASTSWTG
jgi:hypothetical protein